MIQIFICNNITDNLNFIANLVTVIAFLFGIYEFKAFRKEQEKASENSRQLITKQQELLSFQSSHLKFIYKPLFQFQRLELKKQVDTDCHVQLFFINEGATAKYVNFVSPQKTLRILTFSRENKNSITVIKGKEIDVIGIIDLQIPADKNNEEKLKHIEGAKRLIPYTFEIQFEDEIGTKYSQTVKGNGFESIMPWVSNPVELV